MIRRYHTVQGFFEEAEALRAAFDEHFDRPYEYSASRHDIWHYFHVPNMYTVLQTTPDKIFPPELFARFIARLQSWAVENIGVALLTEPQVHLYVDNCGQELHSDFHNGFWGYVFSLTHWDERNFFGGETLLFRDGAPNHKRHHVHGEDVYELVPPRFNQLLVFNDSIVHCVRTLKGTMAPKLGRVVITGHIMAGDPVVTGPLSVSSVKHWLRAQAPQLAAKLQGFRDVHGLITCALEVAANGAVREVSIRGHQLMSTTVNEASVELTTRTLVDFLQRSQLPPSSAASTVVLPLIVPIPDLQPLDIRIQHSCPPTELRSRVDVLLERLKATATWDGQHCGLSIEQPPCAGTLDLGQPGRVHLALDVPIMRPSHRAALEIRVQNLLQQSFHDRHP